VLIHEGGSQTPSTFNTNPATYTGCNGFTGPIVDIVNNTTDDVDLFITGHTHQAYDCVIDGRPVTSSSSAGRLLTDIDLTLGRNGDVKDVQTENLPTYSEGRNPVPRVDRLVKYYEERSRPIREEPVGRVAEDITNDPEDTDDSREFPLGNLIADAQLAATGGDGDVALMNPGGVRNDLLAGVVTYEEAFNVQPFNNLVVTQTFTGAQLLDVLKDQWCGSAAVNVLLPSSTLTYTFDQSIATSIVNTPCASAANPVSDVRIAGVPLDPAASYRVTTNNFLADGGDGFPSLTAGTNRTTLPGFDVDALVAYLAPSETGAPLQAPATDRIDVTP
jgi:5'-nucleotidase